MQIDIQRILVPVDKATQVGLRDVIGRAEAAQIRKILETRTDVAPRGGGPWSRRFRDYQEKLRRGSIFDMAEVLADLLRLQIEKELSFGEQRMLDSAWTRVVHEIAAGWIERGRHKPNPTQIELRGIAHAHIARGEHERALEILTRALEVGGPSDPEIRAEVAALRAAMRGALTKIKGKKDHQDITEKGASATYRARDNIEPIFGAKRRLSN